MGKILNIQTVVSDLQKEMTQIRQREEILIKENAELRAKVRQLEETISLLKGGKNSHSSSTAPSHDLGRSNPISLRQSSGHSLESVSGDSYIRRQVIDIPPVKAIYIEHRSHIKTCPCCQFENHGVFPEQVKAPVQYGNNIEAMTAYLSVYQSMPYARITHLLRDFFKLKLSEGSVDNFLEMLSNKATIAYERIRESVQSSLVVGADETGCRVNGKKHWFHVWQTPLLTFIVSFASRGHKVIEKYNDYPYNVR